MPDKAIGLINLAVTGDERERDTQVIAELIRTHGYRSAGLLTIDANTYMPTTLIVHTAAQHEAVAIVAPGLAHFGSSAKAVALACRLVMPTRTVPRTGHQVNR